MNDQVITLIWRDSQHLIIASVQFPAGELPYGEIGVPPGAATMEIGLSPCPRRHLVPADETENTW